MNEISINTVEIENFRGFKHKKEFKLGKNKDFILFSGINGSGKTSFFDSIEWGFTGNLFRFSEGNNEKDCSKFINFQPSEENQLAKVVIEFGDEDNNYRLTRTLKNCSQKNSDYGEGNTNLKLELPEGKVKEGNEAKSILDEIMINEEWRGKVKFQEIFSQFHLLTQDKLKYFVQGAKMPERHEHITRLLGTDRLLKYKDDFKQMEEKIKSEIDWIEADIECSNNKIEKLNLLVNDEIDFNKGRHKNINEYLNNLIDETNFIFKNYGIDSFEWDKEEFDINKLIIEIRTYIFEKKSKLNEIISGNKSFIMKINNLLEEKKQYDADKIKYIKKQEAIDLVSKNNQYKYLYNNFEKNINFEKFKSKYIEDKKKNEEEYRILEQYLLDSKNIKIKLKQLKEKRVTNIDSLEILDKQLQNNFKKSIDFIINNKSIDFIYETAIKVGKFNINSKKKITYNETLEKLYTVTLQSSSEILKKLKLNINEKQNKLVTLKKKINNMENEIHRLNDLDEGYKTVLTESLKYLEADYQTNKEKNYCPICDRDISKKDLISKIKNKLAQNNLVIHLKLMELNNLKKDKNNFNIEMETILKEINKTYNTFWSIIDEIEEYIEEINDFFDNEIVNTKVNLEELESIFIQEKTINKKYINIKEQLSIDIIDMKELKNYLNHILEKAIKLDINLESFSIDLEEKEFRKLEANMKVFEEKLIRYNLKNSIKEIKASVEKSLEEENLLEELENKLLIKEKKIIELEKELENNYNVQKLSELKNTLAEKVKLKNNKKKVYKNIGNMKAVIIQEVADLNKQIMTENQQFINSIFTKIYPHPYYKNIRFKFAENCFGTKILQILCNDVKNETVINPGYIFSSAQINVVAVSIFLAMSLYQNCTRLKTILLDDPIQHMDDINIIAFIDVLRSSFNEKIIDRQIILSSHDEKIYRLMMKKFRNYDLRAFKFDAYSLKGPKMNKIDN